MFSQEGIKNITACYLCYMCRHVCPIGLTTGREINTPRGKGELGIQILGGNDVLKESAEAMYNCYLCNNCSKWCEDGFEPPKFIREARRDLFANNFLPENIKGVVDVVIKPGNSLYGKKEFPKDLAAIVEKLPEKSPVVLVLGDTAIMRTPAIAEALMSVLKKAGVEFTVLKNEPTVGAELYDLVGELAEVQETAKRFAEAVKKTGCKTVVVLDPFCAKILIQDYPRWGADLGATVRTATSYVAELIEKGKVKIKSKESRKVTYHDPSRLARDIEETEPPRKIIAAVAGDYKEIFLNKNNARCCGTETVAAYAPKIVAMTSRLRMDDALRTEAKVLITASPACNNLLGAVAEPKMVVEDIFVFLDKAV